MSSQVFTANKMLATNEVLVAKILTANEVLGARILAVNEMLDARVLTANEIGDIESGGRSKCVKPKIGRSKRQKLA